MKVMNKLNVAILILLLASPLALAQADHGDVANSPGYVDFGDLSEFSDGEEMVEVDLMQPLLGIFARALGDDEPELGDLLQNLELVNVRVFSYRHSTEEELREHMTKLSGDLRDDEWENIVRVRSEYEMANIFVLLSNAERGKPATDDTAIEGLAVLVLEEDQAVFANVVGHFGMDEITRLGRHFNVPHMEGWDRDHQRKHRSRGDHDDDHDHGG